MDMERPGRVELQREQLHACLRDPVMDQINFLNEVMGRYPDAISFAPGAPNARFFEDLDVAAAIERYKDYLVRERHLGPAAVKHHLYQYGPSRGQINELVARALRSDEGIDVPPQAVVITVGAQEAMLLVLRALRAAPTDVLAVANPFFVGIAGAARVLDVEMMPVDETEAGIDLDALAAVCRTARAQGKRVRALYVAPDFSNPSGTRLELDARRKLLAAAEREDMLLIEDNAYGFMAGPDALLPTLKALDECGRVIHLGTFAKLCFPGARVGYVIADQTVRDRTGARRLLADELASIKSMVTVNTSPICQAVIGGMLLAHDCSFARIGSDKRVLYQDNLHHLLDALDRQLGPRSGFPYRLTWNAPRGGFFVRMRLPVRVDEELLRLSAAQYGVLWTPMAYFYLDGSGNDQLRLACSYLSPDLIDEGVRRLAAFLRDPRVCLSNSAAMAK
jgi:(S)-3,5-dihydroxyphenylglycine transaminase